MDTSLTTRSECRVGGGELQTLLTLGDLPLSGFPSNGVIPPAYPLELTIAPQSQLVQLRHSVHPDEMFTNYFYRSGTNEQMVNHLTSLASNVLQRVIIHAGDVVVDIGANDGTLLQAFGKLTGGKAMLVGFEPSNITPQGAHIHYKSYFDPSYLIDLHKKAKVITSIAMFYDLENPLEFARGIYNSLSDDGVWVSEQHYLGDMLISGDYSVMCHEHLEYYSLTSIKYIMEQVGFTIREVTFNSANGGSFRIYATKGGVEHWLVRKLLAVETEYDYDAFASKVANHPSELKSILWQYKALGKLVLGYGASTKGTTIAHYCQLSTDLLPAIADRNPAKWGTTYGATGIPIISEDEARAMQPDYLLVFPYHFLNSFRERESEFLARGGKFIVPFPTPRIVG